MCTLYKYMQYIGEIRVAVNFRFHSTNSHIATFYMYDGGLVSLYKMLENVRASAFPHLIQTQAYKCTSSDGF